jgi:excisionase family DNA binding protein
MGDGEGRKLKLKLIRQSEAARLLGCSTRTVSAMITRGELTGYRVRGGGSWAVKLDLAEVRALARARVPFGPRARIVDVDADEVGPDVALSLAETGSGQARDPGPALSGAGEVSSPQRGLQP